jgi:pyruvate/2-oxoglutarate dehydrogenase complex dihydrolipoamide acyltransferase (E2) component
LESSGAHARGLAQISSIDAQAAALGQERVERGAQHRVAIVSPVRGTVATVLVEPGQMVMAGATLATVIPADAKLEKKASKVTPKVTPPSSAGAYDPNAWKSKDAEARKRGVERGQQEQVDARDAAKRAEACERARSRLGMLQTSAPIFRTNPDGSRTYMEDKTREAEIARAREVADQACR